MGNDARPAQEQAPADARNCRNAVACGGGCLAPATRSGADIERAGRRSGLAISAAAPEPDRLDTVDNAPSQRSDSRSPWRRVGQATAGGARAIQSSLSGGLLGLAG